MSGAEAGETAEPEPQFVVDTRYLLHQRYATRVIVLTHVKRILTHLATLC